MADRGVNVNPHLAYLSIFPDAAKTTLVRFIYLGFDLQSGRYSVQVEAQSVCQGQDRGARGANDIAYWSLGAKHPNTEPDQL